MNPTMTSILRIRERLVVFFKDNETVILFAVKLLAGLALFGKVNSIGFYRPEFAGFAGGFPYTLALSVVFAVAPPTAAMLLLLLSITLQISMAIEVMAVTFLIGVCIIVFYCRLEPKKNYIIIAMILGFYLKVPYAVVLFAGLYVGFSGIIPVAIGTAVWSFLPMFGGLVQDTTASDLTVLTDVTNLTDTLTDIYTTMQSRVTTDLQWIFTVFIFAMVIVLVYAVSRLTINYSKELSIVLGGFLCIFGNFMAASVSGDSGGLGQVIGFTFLSVILTLIVKFFDLVLDYKKVEYVEYEDAENYYYVKIVNKLKAPAGSIPVKRRRRSPVRSSRPVRSVRPEIFQEEDDDDDNNYPPRPHARR